MAVTQGQSFLSEQAETLLQSLFFPQGAQGVASLKPQFFQQLFAPPGTKLTKTKGQVAPEENLYGLGVGGPYDFSQGMVDPTNLTTGVGPTRRFVQDYRPYDFASVFAGGPNAQAQGILDRSLSGLTAPLDTSGMQGARNAQELFIRSLGAQPYTGIGGLIPAQLSEIFSGLGGALEFPETPQLGAFDPNSVAKPNFNASQYANQAYQGFLGSQPGLQSALQSSLNPQIALPGQSIFEQVNAAPQNALLQQYVDKATEGTSALYDQELQNQIAALQSRFAGEGSYLSSPMFAAQGQLTGDLGAQKLDAIGRMQLQAAEAERNRIYEAATQQYGTEYARNLRQVELQGQQSAQMANMFSQLAGQVAATQGGFESSTYAAQLQAAAQAYGQQADYLASIYNTQANAFSQQQSTAGNILNNALNLMQTGLAQNFEQAMQLAQSQQTNEQAYLDALRREYYQPGQNVLAVLSPFFGLAPKQKSESGGITDIIGPLAQAAATFAVA